MSTLIRARVTLVWAALVLATLVTWWLGTDHPFASVGVRFASAIAIAIAFVKVRYVGLEFMELRTAPRGLRLLFEGWVLVVGGACVVLFVA